MPAEVESHFTVRKPAWHDLTGQYDHAENPASVQEALEWAGADWEPVEAPVFHSKVSERCQSQQGCDSLAVALVDDKHYACGRHSNSAQQKGHVVTPLPLKQLGSYFAVMRDDTGDVLNVANSTYQLYKNRETFELVELLLNSTAPAVKFETGGVLKGGRLVWALARLDEPFEVSGDTSPIYPYVSVLNSHDGSAALRAINTSIRIVCWNTWSAAENEADKSGRQFTFRHTASIRDRVEDARNVLLGARDETAEWVEYANRAIAIPISDGQVRQFLAEFIPMPPDALVSDRVVANVEEARSAVMSFYQSASCASIAGTTWGLVQAVGEYLDHGREYRTKESYVGRSLLKPEKGKNKAMQLIHKITNSEEVLTSA